MKDVKKFLKENNINIDKVLFDDKRLNDLFLYRITYLNKNNIDSDLLLTYDCLPIYIINVLDYVNYDLSKLKEKELTQIKKYCNLLYQYCKNNPELIESNPIFKLNKKVLIELLGTNRLDKLSVIRRKTQEKAIEIYKRIEKDYLVSTRNLYFLIDYFTNTVNTNNKNLIKMQKNLIQKIIDNKLDDSLRTKNFIMQFISFEKFRELGFECKIYFSDKIEKNDKDEISLGETDFGYIKMNATEFRNISFDTFSCDHYDKVRKENSKEVLMIDFIRVIYHELWHAFQFYKMDLGVIDEESIGHLEMQLIKNYIDKKDYNRNYTKQIFENDSEIHGYKETLLFYEKFLNVELIKFLKIAKEKRKFHENQKKYSYKKDKQGKIFLNETYITKYMDKIIKKHPELLNEYYGLKLIYDDVGNPLDIVSLNNNAKKMGFEFEKYVIARILNLDLRKINLDNIEYTSYKNLVLAFVDIIKHSLDSIDVINNNIGKSSKLYITLFQAKLAIIVEISLFLNKCILNERLNTEELQPLYRELDKYFKEANIKIKELGIALNDKELEICSLKQLIGEKKYGRI